jgi:hypothetical protein
VTDTKEPRELEHAHAEDELVAADDAVIGKAFKWSLVVIVGLAVLITAIVLIARRPAEQTAPTEVTIAPPQQVEIQATPPQVRFTDITEASGIDFVHENGATGDKLLPETMGGGVAFIDFDNDGDQDLLFANGTGWPWDGPDKKRMGTPRLYRNEGEGRFSDVTTAAGLDVEMYGMGLAIGDVDGNGFVDVFFANVGKNMLMLNNNGQFSDATERSGVAGLDSDWSTCAAMVDIDNDGDLDLFVGNYVKWSRAIDFEVDYKLVGVGRSYGPPMNFEGTYSFLYRNEGSTFVDISDAAGIKVSNPATGAPMGKALGIAPIDIDLDGYMDLVIANDTVQNFFFHNQQDGTFVEAAEEYGLAFDRNGHATGAMGIDAGHYRNDDELGFFIGNFANEMTSLYVSQGMRNLFADEAIGEGIGSPTRLMLSFGVFLLDYDLDGRLDLLQANGHLEEEINVVQPSQHYEQPSQLFWNCGMLSRGCFVPVEGDSTGDLGKPIVGRGSAFGDIDGDGDLDVVITQTGRRPLVLRNDQDEDHRFIRVVATGDGANTSAIGARIELTAGGTTQVRFVMPTRSYLSQSELPVTLGLGDAAKVESLTVVFPGGGRITRENLEANQVVLINAGDS